MLQSLGVLRRGSALSDANRYPLARGSFPLYGPGVSWIADNRQTEECAMTLKTVRVVAAIIEH